MKTKNHGMDYLWLAVTAFGGLGIEMLYAFWLEPMLYGVSMEQWNSWQSIVHWILTCITWGIVSYLLFRKAQKDYGFSMKEENTKLKTWQWVIILAEIAFVTIVNCIDWGGFKVFMEFQRKGLLLFIFQYIYYAFETVLFLLIIVFGQKAFEEWFHNTKIPYGGILCGLTWGLAHMLSKGSLWMGIEGLVLGFLFGTVYLIVNRDIKKAYLLLLLIFIL